ncbi:unnamed protein product [Ambrosiozyma monospora]|uniref:Unnamed protein product n=1 Tax=Ambrosiozyma monospora TaxID=43982 RepID=A0A9W6YV65_AMBMO|nr:unnamed protein product [Ambrosiozyma monospora]
MPDNYSEIKDQISRSSHHRQKKSSRSKIGRVPEDTSSSIQEFTNVVQREQWRQQGLLIGNRNTKGGKVTTGKDEKKVDLYDRTSRYFHLDEVLKMTRLVVTAKRIGNGDIVLDANNKNNKTKLESETKTETETAERAKDEIWWKTTVGFIMIRIVSPSILLIHACSILYIMLSKYGFAISDEMTNAFPLMFFPLVLQLLVVQYLSKFVFKRSYYLLRNDDARY